MDDDNDLFHAPVAITRPLVEVLEESYDEPYADENPILREQFLVDDKLNSNHPQFIEIKQYLLNRKPASTVATVRKALENRIAPIFLCDTIILRAMCELANGGKGKIEAGSRTYRFTRN